VNEALDWLAHQCFWGYDRHMNTARFHISSEEDSERFGRCLGEHLASGDVVGLSGDLGAGKTFVCRAICEGLGLPPDVAVNSPTFTLIHEYTGGRIPVYHMDFYRLSDVRDLYELALWEYYENNGVCLVEWFDRFADLWPSAALTLSFQLKEGEARVIDAAGEGRGGALVQALAQWAEPAGICCESRIVLK
jgi:tRNA threonylcarbamoyladenosine biosynthesis protein TsaE